MTNNKKTNSFKIYLFLANYRELKSFYGNKLKIEFENIKDYFKSAVKVLKEEIIAEDFKSLTISFKKEEMNMNYIWEFAQKLEKNVRYIQELTKESEIDFSFHAGLIRDDEAKLNPFKKNHESLWHNETLPFFLLSEKTAMSIIENYNIFASEINKIWYTDGIEISESERLRKIYLDRDEENTVEEFINDYQENSKILAVYGELGCGKSSLIQEVRNRYDGNSIILSLAEKKHSEREFYIIVKLIEILLYNLIDEDDQTLDEVFNHINNSSLDEMNKKNLISLSSRYFSDLETEGPTFGFESIAIRLKYALQDAVKLVYDYFDRPICVFVDNYQYVSPTCEEVLLSIFRGIEKLPLKLVLIGREKHLLKDYRYPAKKLFVKNLDQTTVHKYLKLSFPHKIITKTLVKSIHDITGGNFYCLKEYLQYLLNKNAIYRTEKHLKIKDLSEIEIPENLLEIYEDKIKRLNENATDVFKIISVLGEVFYLSDLDSLLHTLNYGEDEVQALNDLERLGFIYQSGISFNISENAVMEQIYNSIPKANRMLLHNQLGEIFEKKGLKDFAFKTFYHFYRGENFDKIFELLPELLNESHLELNFNALKNIVTLSEKELAKKVTAGEKNYLDKWCETLLYKKHLNHADNFNETIFQFEKMVKYLEKQDDKKEYCLKFNYEIAKYYLNEKRYKKFQNIVLKSIEIAQEQKILNAQADFLILHSYSLLQRNKLEEAAQNIDSAESLYKENGNNIERNKRLLSCRGTLEFGRKNFKQALETHKLLYNIYYEDNNFNKVYTILEKIIDLSFYAREYDYTEDCIRRMLHISEQRGDYNKYRHFMIELGVLYSYQNMFLQSINTIHPVIELLEKEGDNKLLVEAYTKLGLIYQYYNEENSAQEALVKALDCAIRLDDERAIFFAYIKLGSFNLYFQKYEEALEYFEESKKIFTLSYFVVISELYLRITKIASERNISQNFDFIIKKIQTSSKRLEGEVVFDIYLTLIKILSFKKHFVRIKDTAAQAENLIPFISDYNKIAEFNKIVGTISKSGNKGKYKKVSGNKINTAIQKRINKRKRHI